MDVQYAKLKGATVASVVALDRIEIRKGDSRKVFVRTSIIGAIRSENVFD